MKDGAQPTDTVRSLLRYKGVLYKYHLQRGVEKGAFTQEVADKRYTDFIEQKEKQIAEAIVKIKNDKNAKKKEALKHEEEVNAKKAQELAEKRAAAVAKEAEQAQQPEENTEAAPEETPQAE